MGREIQHGTTSNRARVKVLNNTSGLPATGILHSATGAAFWYQRIGQAKVTITLAAGSGLSAAWSNGKWNEIGDGHYQIDVPDAAFASGADTVLIAGTLTGYTVIGEEIPLVGYDPSAAIVTANDVSLQIATDWTNQAQGWDNSGGAFTSFDNALYYTAALNTIINDTNELQTDWENGGRLDLLINAIETKEQADARQALLIAEHDTTQADISGLGLVQPNALYYYEDVINSETTGDPIDGATVWLVGVGLDVPIDSTSTNALGEFRVVTDVAGNYELVIQETGFSSKRVAITIT